MPHRLQLPDRRRFGRLQLGIGARLHDRDSQQAVTLVDVSLGGALLEGQATGRLRPQRYVLSIPFGRDPEEAILLACRTVQTGRRHMRVAWTQRPSPENARKLRWLMERQLGSVRVVEQRLPMLVWPTLSARR